MEQYLDLVGMAEFTVINTKDKRVIKVFVLEQWMVDAATQHYNTDGEEYWLVPFTQRWKRRFEYDQQRKSVSGAV